MVLFARAAALTLALLTATALGGCGTTVEMRPTTMNPGSEGKVTARRGAHGNTALTVAVDHLPPPGALGPGLNTYVVWLRPAGSRDFVNMGQVQIDDDRRGRLTTVTPHEDFFILVTGEAAATTSRPSSYVVLQAPVERD
jgi:hypothetical protein